MACGICGTDVRTFYNGDRRIEPGAVLGHEICGEVLEIGPEANADLRAGTGDLVHVISTLYCGICTLCRTGNEHLCQAGGLMGFDFQGAYAELVAVPQVALKNVFRIPEGLDAVHATFADPLSDAICGHKDLEVGLDLRSVVIGAGPVGTAHVALALAQGAGTVYLLETEARRLERRTRCSTTTGPLRRHVGRRRRRAHQGPDRRRRRARHRGLLERARPGAGDGDGGAARARALLRRAPEGHDDHRLPVDVLHYREVAVLGSYASRYRDQVQALDMLEQNTANIRGVVTDVVPLDETPGHSAHQEGEALKVVVTP